MAQNLGFWISTTINRRMHNGGAKIAMGRHVERAAIIVKMWSTAKVREKTRFEPRPIGLFGNQKFTRPQNAPTGPRGTPPCHDHRAHGLGWCISTMAKWWVHPTIGHRFWLCCVVCQRRNLFEGFHLFFIFYFLFEIGISEKKKNKKTKQNRFQHFSK